MFRNEANTAPRTAPGNQILTIFVVTKKAN